MNDIRKVTRMDRVNEWLGKTGKLLAVVMGLLGIAALIFTGGMMRQTLIRVVEDSALNAKAIADTNIRVTMLERGGTDGLVAHERKDDQREENVKERLAEQNRRIVAVETAVLAMPDIRIEVKALSGKMDTVTKWLELHTQHESETKGVK